MKNPDKFILSSCWITSPLLILIGVLCCHAFIIPQTTIKHREAKVSLPTSKTTIIRRNPSQTIYTNSATSTTTALRIAPSRERLKDLEWKKPTNEQVDQWLKQYGEVSRYFRRDVFDANDWVRSRRSTRFVDNFLSTRKSGLLRQISLEVNVLGCITAIVVIYNNLMKANMLPFGLSKRLPLLILPLLPFNLASASLGLLLTFRTNVCYQRWNEARSAWGRIINDSRSLVRMGCIWGQSYKTNKMNSIVLSEILQRLGETTCSFSRSLMNRLLTKAEDEANYMEYCRTKISDEVYASNLYNTKHRPTRALAEITSILVQLDINPLHQIAVEKMVTELCSALGACERILTSPIPTFYSRHTSRFLAMWLNFMPLALYESIKGWNHFALIPIMMTLGLFMLGIEELSFQLEEPFSILPMERMCEDSIRGPVMDQVDRSIQSIQADDPNVDLISKDIEKIGDGSPNPTISTPKLLEIPAKSSGSDFNDKKPNGE